MPIDNTDVSHEVSKPARWRTGIVASFLLACAVVAPMLFLGTPDGHDIDFHVPTWLDTVEQWRADTLYSGWAQNAAWGFGEPRFVFYPPISRHLGALLLCILPGNAVPAAYFLLIVFIAGISMFALAREWLPATHALLAVAFFALGPYMLLCIYQRTAFAELIPAALFPLILHFSPRLISGNKAIAPLALVFAAAWLSDIPAAVVTSYALAFIVIVMAIAHRSLAVLLRGGAAIVLGLALTSFYLIPALHEQRWINVQEAVTPDFLPQNWEYTWTYDAEAHWFYALVSSITYGTIAVTALSAVAAIWQRHRHRAGWSVIAAISALAIFMLLPVSHIVWEHLPKLAFVQFPWRWLLVLSPCMALLLPLSTARIRPVFVALLVLAVVFPAGYASGKTAFWHHGYVERLQARLQREGGYEGSRQFMPPDVNPEALYRHRGTRDPIVRDGEAKTVVRVPDRGTIVVSVVRPNELIVPLLYYPRWRTTVSGHSVISRRDSAGRLVVPVPAGRSTVEITFRPMRFQYLGSAISAGAAFLIAAMMVFSRRTLLGGTGS